MSNDLKRELIKKVKKRYINSRKKEKTLILNELCATLEVSRKHAIRLLSAKHNPDAKRGRKPIYSDLSIMYLKKIYKPMGEMNSKSMVAALPCWLPHYTGCGPEIKRELLSMSHSTIDRKLKEYRANRDARKRSGTQPNKYLKQAIPTRPLDQKAKEPGYVEADTVAHCGGSLSGDHVWSITLTDIHLGFTENRAIWGKSAQNTLSAVRDIEKRLPFEIKAFYTDNGSEFLNKHLIKYFGPGGNRKRPKQIMAVSRPNKKNDNPHVEQKNFTHVRQLFGYDRVDKHELKDIMNYIYKNEHYYLQNFFTPQVKLESKVRIGSKYKRKYSRPKTPYERLLESDDISEEIKEYYREIYKTLNPFKLSENLEMKLKYFFKVLNSFSERNVA